ncbi:MAG: GAF domain-containing protein [Microscillaceae bacterium]|nr:GAF domain-containing protein [Microscillaceae bacterium]
MNLFWQIREKFKDLRLVYKFSIIFFLLAFLTLISVGFFSYYQSRELLLRNSFQYLETLTRHKKILIEEYFQDLKGQMLAVSQNPSTIAALRAYQEGFAQHPPLANNEEMQSLHQYYEAEILPELAFRKVNTINYKDFLPKSALTAALQQKYLQQNPNPREFKYKMLASEPQRQPYDQIHARFHPAFVNYCEELKIEDVLLIDTEGNVVYSVKKRTDFATNLHQEPYKSGPTARLYRRLQRRTVHDVNEEKVDFEDYDFYEPNLYEPSAFVGTVIYDQSRGLSQKIGVLIFQVKNEVLENILVNDKNWLQDGLGLTGETAIIGPDYLIRNNTRRFLEDPLVYVQNLLTSGVDSLTVLRIQRLKTTKLLRQYKIEASVQALENAKTGSQNRIDFLGEAVLDIYAPIDILGTRWAILTEMNASEIFAPVANLRNRIIAIIFVVSLSIGGLGYLLARSLSRPMLKVRNEVSMLAQGVFPKPSQRLYKDELGEIDEAMNQLIANMQEVARFAESIGQGNFDFPYRPVNDKDILGNVLLQMRDNLKRVNKEEKERNWINTGTALFGEILRNNSSSLQSLSNASIAELVHYLGANQGVFYFWNDQTERLWPLSSFAYDKYKYLQTTFARGEGLVGQSFMEKQTIYLKEIPENYPKILSGLGQAAPRCILLVPIQTPEKIYGVMELASFKILAPFEIKFVESIAEDIATTLQSIQINEDTRRLLIESQKATERLKQQEEEIRQNFEELMASQEEVKRQQAELEKTLSGHFPLRTPSEVALESNEITLHISNDQLDLKVKEAIQRQKNLLEEALDTNRKREALLRTKILRNHVSEAPPRENP